MTDRIATKTVSELIKELKKMPKDMRVFVTDDRMELASASCYIYKAKRSIRRNTSGVEWAVWEWTSLDDENGIECVCLG